MENVKVADEAQSKVRAILVASMGKKIMPVSTDTLLEVLHGLERLSVLERHLYNLTSKAYNG